MIDVTTPEYAGHAFFFWLIGALTGWAFAGYRAYARRLRDLKERAACLVRELPQEAGQ